MNAANLKEAFSAREEILSLLHPALDASPGGRSEGASELPEDAGPRPAG